MIALTFDHTSPMFPSRSRPVQVALIALVVSLTTCTSSGEEQVYSHGPKKTAETQVVLEKKVVKAPEIKAADGDNDTKAADAKAPKSRFKQGLAAPKGLSPKEVIEYNVAQGDPTEGTFTLEQAFAGDEALKDKSKGKLFAVIHTERGDLRCELFEDKVPNTVANFVGLARGTRPWYDKMDDKWVTDTPYYKDIKFHRVVKDFMVQTGDRTGTGRSNPGYIIVDEFDKSLRHRGPGILSMANRGKNTGSSQFFITVKSTPHLDNKHAVFGKCADAKIAVAISEVPVQGSRPIKHEIIKSISIERAAK